MKSPLKKTSENVSETWGYKTVAFTAMTRSVEEVNEGCFQLSVRIFHRKTARMEF